MKIALRLLTLALCCFTVLQIFVIDNLKKDIAEIHERDLTVVAATVVPLLFACGYTVNNGYLQAPPGVETFSCDQGAAATATNKPDWCREDKPKLKVNVTEN